MILGMSFHVNPMFGIPNGVIPNPTSPILISPNFVAPNVNIPNPVSPNRNFVTVCSL